MSNKEIIRHEQYCQMIKEISGSDEYLIVGPKDTYNNENA